MSLAIQVQGLLESEMEVKLFDLNGKMLQQTTVQPGSTICYLDTRTLYIPVKLSRSAIQ